MKSLCFDTVLAKLGLMRKAEVDKTVKAIRTAANNDARLAATLFEECRRLQQENDEMADEIGRLHDEIDLIKAGYST